MISYSEAIEIVMKNIKTATVVELPIMESLNSVIAGDVVSPVDIPRFSSSAMDGYAVRSEDTAGASEREPVRLNVIFEIQAGDEVRWKLKVAEAARIMTGAPLPDGADCVIEQELVSIENRKLLIKNEFKPGRNIRFKGEEVKRGGRALPKGTVITVPILGFLVNMGLKSVKVHMRPKVGVITTGRELVPLSQIGEGIPSGKIPDVNSAILLHALGGMSIQPSYFEISGDEKEEISCKIESALEVSSLVVITGGVSVGKYDFVKEVLVSLGVETLFWKVAQKPGKPLFFGKRGDKLIFGLPGNPVSVFIAFYEYLRPAILSMMGYRDIFMPEVRAKISRVIKNRKGRTCFLAGILYKKRGQFYVDVPENQRSHILSSFAGVNSIAVIDELSETVQAGSEVVVQLLPLR
ncbi:MAG: gephyrin-like molybdotransferase Glp [Fidelibacterota bacterium]